MIAYRGMPQAEADALRNGGLDAYAMPAERARLPSQIRLKAMLARCCPTLK